MRTGRLLILSGSLSFCYCEAPRRRPKDSISPLSRLRRAGGLSQASAVARGTSLSGDSTCRMPSPEPAAGCFTRKSLTRDTEYVHDY